MKFSIEQTADLVTFTEEILNGRLHFLCSVNEKFHYLSLCIDGNPPYQSTLNSIWLTLTGKPSGKPFQLLFQLLPSSEKKCIKPLVKTFLTHKQNNNVITIDIIKYLKT